MNYFGFLLFRSVWSMRVSDMHPGLFVLNIWTDMLCLRCFVTHKDLLADAFWIHMSALYPKQIRRERQFVLIVKSFTFSGSRCCHVFFVPAPTWPPSLLPWCVSPSCTIDINPPHTHTSPLGNIDRLREWEWARETNSRKSFEVAFRRASLLAVSPRRVTFAERE